MKKIVIKIPDDVYEEYAREIDKITDRCNEELGALDPGIDMFDEDEVEEMSYSQELAEEWREDYNGHIVDESVLEKDEVIKKIYKTLESDAGLGYWGLSGAFVEIENFYVVKYYNGNENRIRVFCNIKAGLEDENGREVKEWFSETEWNEKGGFISAE